MNPDLLELRNKIKQKKPEFIRQDGLKKVKLRKVWRQPKGGHSKKRSKKKGHGKQPSIGYRSPKEVRGLTRSGKIPIRIFNVSQISGLTNNHSVILGKSLGLEARLKLLKLLKEKHISLHLVDLDWYLTKIESRTKAMKEKNKAKNKPVKKEELKIEPKQEKTSEEKQQDINKLKQKVLEKGI